MRNFGRNVGERILKEFQYFFGLHGYNSTNTATSAPTLISRDLVSPEISWGLALSMCILKSLKLFHYFFLLVRFENDRWRSF